MTQKQKETRLKFAKAEKKKGFKVHKHYVFYDESLFQGLVAPRGQWVDALEEPEPRPNVAHPPQVMGCWGSVLVGENTDSRLFRLERGLH